MMHMIPIDLSAKLAAGFLALLLVAAITEIVHLLRWDLRVTFSVTVLVMMLVCMLGYSPPSRTWHDKRNETDAVVSCAPACRGGSDSP